MKKLILLLLFLLSMGCSTQKQKTIYNKYPYINAVQMMNSLAIQSQLQLAEHYLLPIGLSPELQKYTYLTCEEYEVDYFEALAIMTVENTKYDPDIVHKNTNGSKDIGLFQINTINLVELQKKLKIKDLSNPQDNILAGIYILSKYKNYNQNQRIMAYNMGLQGMKNAVSKGIKTTDYSVKVVKTYNKLKELKN